MKKVNEFRIGNLVTVKCNCGCHKEGVTMMHFTACCSKPIDTGVIELISGDEKFAGVHVMVNGKRYKLEDVEGVRLTKEEMSKLGFVELSDKERWLLAVDGNGDTLTEADLPDEIHYFIVDYEGSEMNGWANAWYFNGIYRMADVSFDYVHELQNFYYAITMGEEIPLNVLPKNN